MAADAKQIMKDSTLVESTPRRRAPCGTAEEAHGAAPTVAGVAGVLPSSTAVKTETASPFAPSSINSYMDSTSGLPIMTQSSVPQTMAQGTSQPASNEPGMSSMAAVLLALQMVGLSPTQPNSRPVIWIPVDMPEPTTTQLQEGESAEMTEQSDRNQPTAALEDSQKEAKFPGRDKRVIRKSKNARTGLAAGPTGTEKSTATHRPQDGVPTYGRDVYVGAAAIPGTMAGLGALPKLSAPTGRSRNPKDPNDEGKGKLKDGDKDQESGKSADQSESAFATAHDRKNTMAVYVALTVLLSCLTAAFGLLLALGRQHSGFDEQLVSSATELSVPTESSAAAVTQEDMFHPAPDMDERRNDHVGPRKKANENPRLAAPELRSANDTSPDELPLRSAGQI